MNRIVLTTGGTGGHIFPALAVAEEIRRRFPGADILFVGGAYGPEGDLAARAGLRFAGLPVRGFLGRGLRMAGAAFGMVRGLAKAAVIMGRFKPEAVVGFGGYAAFAAVTAARWRGIPTAVHEQNSFPGLANRILARRADRVFISLPDGTGQFPPAKTLLTGNPVRASVAALAATPRPVRPRDAGDGGRVLVLGGSQGAKALNDAILANLGVLLDGRVSLWHQTGPADADRVREAYRKAGAMEAADAGGFQLRVDPFIEDVAGAYAWADMAVCRAGATTIAELTAAGLPALFVPFPAAALDHQTKNARQLADAGAAEHIAQAAVSADGGNPALLGQRIEGFLSNPEKLRIMGEAARSLARPGAAAAVADAVEAMIGGTK